MVEVPMVLEGLTSAVDAGTSCALHIATITGTKGQQHWNVYIQHLCNWNMHQ